MTIAAARFGLIGSAGGQSDKTNPAKVPTIESDACDEQFLLRRTGHAARKSTAHCCAHVTRGFGPLPRLLFVLLAVAMSLTQPATVLAQQPAKSDSSAAGAAMARATEDNSIRPFGIRAAHRDAIPSCN